MNEIGIHKIKCIPKKEIKWQYSEWTLWYTLYNKKIKEKYLKKKPLKTSENPLVCTNVLSDNEWLVDDAHESSSVYLQEDHNVDYFNEEKR